MLLKVSFSAMLFLFFGAVTISASEELEGSLEPSDQPGEEDERVERVAEIDTNQSGKVDLKVAYDEDEEKVWEALDYNHDGEMDNFYFYSAGVLVRQEIDSNYDGNIDLWCTITDGIYVESYWQDVNHDGKVDKKRYFE